MCSNAKLQRLFKWEYRNVIEMRWERTLTFRMIGRMATLGSWTYWICCGQNGYKSPIISMGKMDKGKVYRKRGKWFGNGNARNEPEILKADIARRILNGDMGMFGRTNGKLLRIWDYGHPMEWMIYCDGYGGSCSVWNGTGPQVADQNCCSLAAVTEEEYMCVCGCLCVMCSVRTFICWTGMCMSCCFYRSDWVPKIRDIHHGLLSLVDPLCGIRSDDDTWTYMYPLHILYHGYAVVTMIVQQEITK